MLILFIWKVMPLLRYITAVDTTLGEDDVQPFYPKEMKHSGFDMSKFFFCYCI